MSPPAIEGLDTTVSPDDYMYKAYERFAGAREYFMSGLRQMVELDELLRAAGRPLAEVRSVVDYACHYGRLTRCLRAQLPKARIVAADISVPAIRFCAETFGCEPLHVAWEPEKQAAGVEPEHDLVLSSSLLTHTPFHFLPRVLTLWERMLVVGGSMVFTYRGERFVQPWLEGALDHEAPIALEVRREQVEVFRRHGHAFASLAGDYGMGFVGDAFLGEAIGRFPSLRLVTVRPGTASTFGQDVAVVKKCA